MTKLYLEKGQNLVFLGTNSWQKDEKTTLHFLTLADPVNYVQHRFIVNPKEINLNFEVNTPVEVQFELSLFKGNTSIRPLAIFPAVPVKA